MHALRFPGLRLAAALLLAALTSLVHAAPVVIGFEGQAPDDDSVLVTSPYAEGGFQLSFTGNSGTVEIFGKNFVASPEHLYNGHGSAVLGFCPPSNLFCFRNANVLTLTHAGSPFSMSSLDLANLYLEASRGDGSTPDYAGEMLGLVGTMVGGGTVTASLAVGTDWTTYQLVGFTNLVSVSFTPSAGASNFFAIDNLRLDNGAATGTVPEPMTLALVGGALAAMAATTRRRRGAPSAAQ